MVEVAQGLKAQSLRLRHKVGVTNARSIGPGNAKWARTASRARSSRLGSLTSGTSRKIGTVGGLLSLIGASLFLLAIVFRVSRIRRGTKFLVLAATFGFGGLLVWLTGDVLLVRFQAMLAADTLVRSMPGLLPGR